jgi:lactoylglutathione lyase
VTRAVRLGYAILFVSDLERSVAFYRDVLGFPFRFANESYAEFATGGAKFSLYARSHLPELIGVAAPAGPAPWPQGEVAFLCDDVDGEHERLRNAGVRVLAPPTDRPWGERTLHVADPDGNVVELTAERTARPAATRTNAGEAGAC